MPAAFECLRRLSLRCFNGLRPFLGLTSMRASPFNAFGVYRYARFLV